MGLMDVLNGMQHGPRGPSGPSTGSGGGMSPMTMAILGLLAYKTFKSFTSLPTAAPAAPGTAGAPGHGQATSPGGGGISDILKNGLGTVLAGGAAGGICVSTPRQPTGRPRTASFSARKSTTYIICR